MRIVRLIRIDYIFQPSTFSNGETSIPVLPNVLKVYLENGQTKSFKYDSSTTVRDVVSSLLQKLCIRAAEHFSLVVEHFKSLRRNKLTLLDPNESVARVRIGIYCESILSIATVGFYELAFNNTLSITFASCLYREEIAFNRFLLS